MLVGTPKIGYLRMQALSQNKEQHVHPRVATQAAASDRTSAEVGSGAVTCPAAPYLTFLLR
jgi:hypothetical protein